ncbi:hypothetical protein DEJ28_03260 [Curtobacterium sp. MCPF17_002]|uniref:hypothetical protein n=1 Tax=Curtobacterium sp. MCPF17_002 TaxID=2175645 RepID=UPI0015E87A6C|nr:hypothetical protein [Curtobacterium sp. MCPF17_002]WIB78134.1 hypothetical protein DEJ28_03260 [Curtobacterium sp. MCPF17_002]
MSIKNVLMCATVLGTVVAGGIALDSATAPDAHAACYGSVTLMKGKNNSCSNGARHWNAIKNANPKYGDWVGKGRISQQKLCWANVVSYGMTAR